MNDERVLLEITCANHPCKTTAQVPAIVEACIGDGGRIEISYNYSPPPGWWRNKRGYFSGFYCALHPEKQGY